MKYKIRKLISTRYDLNEPIYANKYSDLVPKLNLINKQYSYEPESYNYVNQDVNVDLPTKEEFLKPLQLRSPDNRCLLI